MTEYNYSLDKRVRLHTEPLNFTLENWTKMATMPSGVSVGVGSSHTNCGNSAGVLPSTLIPGPDSISVALKADNFKVAVEILLHLYRALTGSVRIEELRSFVDYFCDQVRDNQPSSLKQDGYLSLVDALCCPICFGILLEPVTTLCGHSYCRKCLQKETVGKSCRRCRSPFTNADINRAKLNVLAGALLEKWWAKDLEAAAHRNEGNFLFETVKGESALNKYSQALAITPNDHLSLGNRSHVLLTLGRSEEALADVDAALKNCPFWAKGYFRKSSVLVSLGRYEEAFINLSICLALVKTGKSEDEATLTSVKNEMVKVLHKIFLQAAGTYRSSTIRRHSFEQLSYAPYPSLKSCHRLGRDHYKSNPSDKETQYNSSGDEIESHERDDRDVVVSPGKMLRKHNSDKNKSSQYCKTKKNTQMIVNQAGSDTQVSRIHRLFDRAMQEVSRVYNDIEGRTRNEASRTAKIGRPVEPSLISVSDVECTLCYRLLHQPVTTLCGHTYCRSCLERCLDHSPYCPLCKTSLEDYLAHRRHAITQFLDIAILQFLPTEYTDRVQQHVEEIAEVTSIGMTLGSAIEIPIFVCTMAFPTVPCPLHVFEPRYRLMIRRCVESGGKRFGMCSYIQDGENNYAEYGTLLEIRNVQYFADGRSVVDTVGRRRFKVLSKSQKDGYNTATIELLQDRPILEETKPYVQNIHDQVYNEAKEWMQTVSQVLRQRIHTHFGPMPAPEENWIESSEGPAWTWWLLAILPLDTKAQLAILSMNSLQKRLESIQKVLRYVKTTRM